MRIITVTHRHRLKFIAHSGGLARAAKFVPLEARIRFWRKIVIGQGSKGCWLWIGALGGSGYGNFTDRAHGRQNIPAHVFCWKMYNGPIPPERILGHKCDIKNCVRPDHLFLTTFAGNSKDMVLKGRSKCGAEHPLNIHPERRPRGERHGQAKLTESQVREIRDAYSQGTISQQSLATHYGVTQSLIGHVVRRTIWTHIA